MEKWAAGESETEEEMLAVDVLTEVMQGEESRQFLMVDTRGMSIYQYFLVLINTKAEQPLQTGNGKEWILP